MYIAIYRDMSEISRYSKYIHRSIISTLQRYLLLHATKESTDKPSYHAVGKENIVGVDRKMFRSNAWEHFGWHRKAIGSSLGCVQQVPCMGVQKGQQYIQYMASPKILAWCYRRQQNVSLCINVLIIVYSPCT